MKEVLAIGTKKTLSEILEGTNEKPEDKEEHPVQDGAQLRLGN